MFEMAASATASFAARSLVAIVSGAVSCSVAIVAAGRERMLIPGEAAPQFRDDAAPCNGMMPPPDSEMIAPPITE